MNWDDEGFLISKLKYNENSVIADLFTEDHGRVAGIIFGASSKKIKGYLQIGNLFHINCNYKNETKIGSFKVEIINPYTPYYFNNINKLHCVTSAMSMIKLLTAENQINKNIFILIKKFFNILEEKEWEKKYLFWELELLKLSGFELNLEKIVQKKVNDNKIEYFVQSSTEKKNVPSFFIDKKIQNLEKSELIKGYNLITNYLEKNVLNPNNLSHPNSRLDFINLLR
tara:strand:+ start:447 stop:1127 length:681 start_codon:yes stop_codon:yes gene_type:complete